MKMGNVEAIKTFFGTEQGGFGPGRKVENKEVLELRKSLTKEEWEEMAAECCKALGVEHTPS